MSETTKIGLPFAVAEGGGLDLHSPADETPQGSYRRFSNLEVNQVIHAPQSRRAAKFFQGSNQNFGGPVHSILVANNPYQPPDITPPIAVLVGAGTALFLNGTQIDSGYSGDPLSIVEYREPGNSNAWAIIGDRNKNTKVQLFGLNPSLPTVCKLGISPPGAVPPYTGAGAPATAALVSMPGTPGNITSTSGAATASQSGSQNSWANPSYATGVANGQFATVTLYGSNASVNTSNTLILTNFGLTVPATATVLGIQVSIVHEQSSGTSAVYDDFIQLTGVNTTGSKHSPNPWTSGSAETFIYGGSADLWGATAPISGQAIDSPAFGVLIAVDCTQLPGNGAVAGIDSVTVQVWYTTASVGGALDSSTGVGYDWRYTYYNSITMAESNPSAIMGSVYYPVQQCVTLTPGAASSDPQVDTIRWWRRGGTLGDNWRLVGTQANSATTTFTDCQSDQAIASNPILSLQNDVPVTTVKPDNSVTMYQQPVQFIWGLFNGSLFAVDPQQPGFVDWSNPYAVDGWSSLNNVEVSAPSDNLQNGFTWNGRNFVLTRSRLYEGFPLTLGTVTTYQYLDTGAGFGLAVPWAFAADKSAPRVWYLTEASGVVEYAGGGQAQSVTEKNLWPIFDQAAVATPIENLWPIGIYSPAPGGKTPRMRFCDNELRISYFDSNPAGATNIQASSQVLAYHIQRRSWRHANYPWAVAAMEIFRQGEQQALLYGGGDGGLYLEQQTFGGADDTLVVGATTPSYALRTGYTYAPDYEVFKEYQDLILDYSSSSVPVSLTALFFDGTLNPVTASVANSTSRGQTPISLQDVYARDMAVDVAWTATSLVTVYGFEILFRPETWSIPHVFASMSAWGQRGFFHVSPSGWVVIRSQAAVTITFNTDQGQNWTITLPASSGNKQKFYLSAIPPNKETLVSVSVDSTMPFRLYSDESYIPLQGWSDIREVEARVFAP